MSILAIGISVYDTTVIMDEDIVVDPVISVQNGHEAGHLRPMTDVVRRIARLTLIVDDAVHPGIDQAEGPGAQVMYAGDTLTRDRDGDF